MEADEKICPFCAETIKRAAIKCRYCGSDLPRVNVGDFDLEDKAPPVVAAPPPAPKPLTRPEELTASTPGYRTVYQVSPAPAAPPPSRRNLDGPPPVAQQQETQSPIDEQIRTVVSVIVAGVVLIGFSVWIFVAVQRQNSPELSDPRPVAHTPRPTAAPETPEVLWKKLVADSKQQPDSAITQAKQLMAKYPTSPYKAKAAALIADLRKQQPVHNFQAAKNEFAESHFDLAGDLFRNFVKDYPNNALVPQARSFIRRSSRASAQRDAAAKKEAAAQAERDARAGSKLEVLSFHWHTESGFAMAEGQVKNISDEPLKNVEAVATFTQEDGSFVTTGNALIEYNPILPGQTSPFHAMATYNPAMKNAQIAFKDLLGGSIETYQK